MIVSRNVVDYIVEEGDEETFETFEDATKYIEEQLKLRLDDADTKEETSGTKMILAFGVYREDLMRCGQEEPNRPYSVVLIRTGGIYG